MPTDNQIDDDVAEPTETETGDAGREAQAKPKTKPAPAPAEGEGEESALKSALRKERERADRAEKEAKALKRDKEERDRQAQEALDRELPELQRAQKLTAETQRQLAEANARADKAAKDLANERIGVAVEREAGRDGATRFRTPKLARQLVDLDRLEYDPETGVTTGVLDELKRVLRDYPDLAATGETRGGTPPRDGGRAMPNGRSTPPKEVNPYDELSSLGGINY